MIDDKTGVQAIIEELIAAFTDRDLERCVDLFHDDATIDMPLAPTQRGRKAIESWLKARFNAEMTIIRIEDISVQGESAVVTGAITSRKLKAWRIGTITGRALFEVRGGKIIQARFKTKVDAVTASGQR